MYHFPKATLQGSWGAEVGFEFRRNWLASFALSIIIAMGWVPAESPFQGSNLVCVDANLPEVSVQHVV